MIGFDLIKTLISIFGFALAVLSFYYCKNEAFYLFVQRFFLKFKKIDKAFIDVKISLIADLDDDILKKLEVLKIDNAKVDIINKKIKYNEAGNLREFDLLISETAYHQKQILISSKYPIYSIDYEKEFENFREIHNKIKEKIAIISTNIDFILSFEGRNPYESFFIKQMPIQAIEDFSIKLNINEVKIEAKKNKIISRSRDIDKLIFNVQKILTFKTLIITRV